MDLCVTPSQLLPGTIKLPGDKSISHRCLIIAALAEGRTVIEGFLAAHDCLATLNILRALGVEIALSSDQVIVEGVGLNGLKPPTTPLDCGNSGTTMRLMTGILAAQSFNSTLVGDHSLQQRPMGRVIEPLQQMGARIEGQQVGEKIVAPLQIQGSPLQGIRYHLPLASAQVKSAILLAGLYAHTPTQVIENSATRDHTERLLQHFGGSITVQDQTITLIPSQNLKGRAVQIPGDISAAAFFMVAASLQVGSTLVLQDVGINHRRRGIIPILQQMGAPIALYHQREIQGELWADIHVQGATLKGITTASMDIASCIDEFPILFIAAAHAQGKTTFRGLQELRYKESDRIATMAQGLRTQGIGVTELRDGLIIEGGEFQGGWVDSHGDHRVAMAFAVAGLIAKKPISIKNCANIATSFPNFIALANQLGLSVAPVQDK